MEPATLNGLMAMTQKELPLSEAVQKLLHRETITVRVIDRGSLHAFFPLVPDEVLEDPPAPADADPAAKAAYDSEPARNKRYDKRLQAWLRAAPEAERIAHRLATERVKFHTIAYATLEPKLTVLEAERLAGEADDIYLEILLFSGLAKKKAQETKTEAAAA